MSKNKTFVLDGEATYKQNWKIAHNFANQSAEIFPDYDHDKLAHLMHGTIYYYHKEIGVKLSKKEAADFNRTVFAYTKTSIAIADAFISCWDEKYRSNLVRPETLINTYFDDEWKPILQTPPFPEYTSGHSVVSGAASIVLTSIFGDNFSFADDTEVPYGLPIRSFPSFKVAADEATISRMYGGIHFRAAVEVGVGQGRKIGELVTEKLTMSKK